MAAKRVMCSIPEALANRIAAAGLSPSELLKTAALDQLGDKKSRPVGKRLDTVEKAIARLTKIVSALAS